MLCLSPRAIKKHFFLTLLDFFLMKLINVLYNLYTKHVIVKFYYHAIYQIWTYIKIPYITKFIHETLQ